MLPGERREDVPGRWQEAGRVLSGGWIGPAIGGLALAHGWSAFRHALRQHGTTPRWDREMGGNPASPCQAPPSGSSACASLHSARSTLVTRTAPIHYTLLPTR